jgi:hypothetical protein
MPKRVIDVSRSWPFLDLASHGRRGPGGGGHLAPQDVAAIARTVRRTPEVMVKVLNRGGGDLRAVGRHLSYISRKGAVELETDEGERLAGEDNAKSVLKDWDLDLEETRSRMTLDPTTGRHTPKLVQKLILSMPPGTPPDKVLAAARSFAREEFALRHRYIMVLHTDEPHPHVHLVVKAMGENGERLNIRRETLRAWRGQFAEQLRSEGVAANATPRQVRGACRPQKKDGIHRAMLRSESRHHAQQVGTIVREMRSGGLRPEAGKPTLLSTRGAIERGWQSVAAMLDSEGQTMLGREVRIFMQQMPPPLTAKEWYATQAHERARARTIGRSELEVGTGRSDNAYVR